MSEEYLEPSPPAERKRRLIQFGVFVVLVLAVGAYVGYDITSYKSIGRCAPTPVVRELFIFKISTWLFGALVMSVLAYRSLLAGQYPLPTAVIFRRTRIRRGRYIKFFAAFFLLASGLLVLMAGLAIAYFVFPFGPQIPMFCT